MVLHLDRSDASVPKSENQGERGEERLIRWKETWQITNLQDSLRRDCKCSGGEQGGTGASGGSCPGRRTEILRRPTFDAGYHCIHLTHLLTPSALVDNR